MSLIGSTNEPFWQMEVQTLDDKFLVGDPKEVPTIGTVLSFSLDSTTTSLVLNFSWLYGNIICYI